MAIGRVGLHGGGGTAVGPKGGCTYRREKGNSRNRDRDGGMGKREGGG